MITSGALAQRECYHSHGDVRSLGPTVQLRISLFKAHAAQCAAHTATQPKEARYVEAGRPKLLHSRNVNKRATACSFKSSLTLDADI